MPYLVKPSDKQRESDPDLPKPAEFGSENQYSTLDDEAARSITEAASDAIITIDERSQIVFVNRAAEKIFGYSISEMIGQELQMLMPEYLRHLHRTGIARYVETGQRHISWESVELPGLHRDGREIALELSFCEFKRNGSRFFTGIARNITRRKHDAIRLLLQNSIIQILSQSTSLAEASIKLLEAICSHLDWEVGEFWAVPPDKKHLHLLAAWHTPQIPITEFDTARRSTEFAPGVGIPGKVWVSEAPLWFDQLPLAESVPRTQAAHSIGLNAAFGIPILTELGIAGVINFFCSRIAKPEPALLETMRTIAGQIAQFVERKNAQRELQNVIEREYLARLEAEALTRQLSSLQRITDAALSNFNLEDLLSEMLRRIREVLNVDTAAVLLLEAQSNELVAWAAQGLEEEVEQGVRIPAGAGFAGKIVVERKPLIIPDLSQANVFNPLLREKGIRSLLGVPLLVEGRSIGVIHVGTFQPSAFTNDDVNLLQLVADRIALTIEKARLNEIEREARTKAEQANQMKEEFLTILSHELRTPLTPIMGWSHMIQAGLLSEHDFPQALAVIVRNSKTLKNLIDDLLDMSAIVNDKMRIEFTPVSLQSVLRDAVDNFNTEAQAAGIDLIAPELNEQIIVMGDRARLLQTFGNIIHNAIKFTPQGGTIEIATSLSDGFVNVSIRDSGTGIEKEFLPDVFERFRQADSSRTRSHGGLGLGLALVRSFVDAHGGEVTAWSPGKEQGTTFSVRLPIQYTGPSRISVPTEKIETIETSQARILIIEDEVDTLEMLAATFAAGGFAVTPCASGTQALEAARRLDIDAIVSDIAMPVIDGFDLIKQLRELPGLKKIPAIALTGYASEKDAAAALQAGFDVHLCKPVDPAELTALVGDLLQSRELKAT